MPMRLRALVLLVAVAGFAAHLPARAQLANFRHEAASAQARHVADWALHSGDSGGLPFVIVDKVHSRVFVFDAAGTLTGAASALLGSALGDESVPGIGERRMSEIRPRERTTPAGRFVASLARSLNGEEILWIDYDAAVAMHRVIATAPKEQRLRRLASGTPAERRITFGCINVPVAFFEQVVVPAFRGTAGIVYVLPETRPARETFGSYDVPPGPARP